MRISTRTGLAAIGAAVVAVVLVTLVASVQFQQSLRETVDEQLVERAETAPILVAVGERVAISELSGTVAGARVEQDGTTIELGQLPDDELPPIAEPGWRTVRADGEDWRLLAIEVNDVPREGDTALVELAAPLGDVEARAAALRRRTLLVGLVAAIGAGLIGLVFGRRASKPLTDLAADVARVGGPDPGPGGDAWAVRADSGTPEVDEIADVLNDTFDRLAAETERREAALRSARAFASAASHELRTPLQSALTNLDVALLHDAADHRDHVATARAEVKRMGSSLAAVRALTEVDLIDESWFEPADLVDVADRAVAGVSTPKGGGRIDVVGDDRAPVVLWVDGARLAIENVVRNAVVHGAPREAHIVLTVDATARTVTVDDNGPGVAAADRQRVLDLFQRASTDTAGSGLGLAFVDRVVRAHGGATTLEESPLGGLRVTMAFRQPTAGAAAPRS